jgi:hypothetical protein
MTLSNSIDAMGFMLLIVYIVLFFTYSKHQNVDILTNTLIAATNFVNEQMSSLYVGLFLFGFYTMAYLFRVPMETDVKPYFISFIENSGWIMFIFTIFVLFFNYVLRVSLTDMLAELFHFDTTKYKTTVGLPSISGIVALPDNAPFFGNAAVSGNATVSGNTAVSGNATVSGGNQVFNVSNNLYTYDDAQAICASYGATLATYDQVEETYSNGGEWCNYGWSADQMILFPTQKLTWKALQDKPGHENDCGRPGVNGGHIDNPYIKFGVNCFGQKPPPTADDLARLAAKKQTIPPKTPQDKAIDANVQYWKDNAAKLLQLNSYNNNTWSQY